MNLDPKRKILQFLNRAPVFHFRPHPGKGIPPVSLRAPAKPGKPLSTRHWILKNSMENFLSPGLLPYRHSQNPFRMGMSDKLLSLGTCFTKKKCCDQLPLPRKWSHRLSQSLHRKNARQKIFAGNVQNDTIRHPGFFSSQVFEKRRILSFMAFHASSKNNAETFSLVGKKALQASVFSF